MHQHRRAGVLMEFAQSAHVIDVRVSADDGFHDQPVAPNQVQNACDFIARVHHQRFARGRIADDGTVALQHPHGDGDLDQSVRGGIYGSQPVAHTRDYSIGVAWIFVRRCITGLAHCPIEPRYPLVC